MPCRISSALPPKEKGNDVTVAFFTPGIYVFPTWVALVSVAILIAPKGTQRMSTTP